MQASAPFRGRNPRTTRLAFGLCAAGAVLAWAVLSQGLDRVRPSGPPSLSIEQPEAAWDTAAAEARRLLLKEPLSARAFSRLGQVSALKGDVAHADLMMEAAARRSLRDAPSQSWIFARALERGDEPAAMAAFDVLMRRRPDLFDAMVPAVLDLLERQPDARAALAARLALSPAWRPRFMTAYSRQAGNPQEVHAVLQALRETSAPPSDAEMKIYMQRLLKEKSYVAAYVAWAQHQAGGRADRLAADGGVNDGDFEDEPGLPPFGWTFRSGDGAAAQRGFSAEGSGGVLRASAVGGLARRTLAEQMLVLAPGTYQMTGRAWVRSGDPEGRFVWTLRCVGGAELASFEERGASRTGWKDFSVELQIPGGCPAQMLSLQARPGTSLAPTEVDYDRLAVTRKGRS
jgi:hypothetical protein